MENRHLQLTYEESILFEKNILLTELSFLELSRRLRNYKQLRKKELMLKSTLKTALKTLELKISLIKSGFPKEEQEKLPKIRLKKVGIQHHDHLQAQLEEIRQKLERLK